MAREAGVLREISMSSILTNNGAMVALQTLQNINKSLGDTQSQISTGKSVDSAKSNAAVWAISKQMESDVQGFKSIQESLALGESTVAVARNASETVTDLLTKIKGKIVASQESNVDREKIQTDIAALREQIESVTGAAQFNGLNLLENKETTTAYNAAGIVDGSSEVQILSSLDRSSSGVSTTNITVNKVDLHSSTAKAGSLTLAAGAATNAGTAAANGATDATYTIVGEKATAGRTANVMAGDGYAFNMAIFDAALSGTPFASLSSASKKEALYVANDGDTVNDIASGLAERINFRLAEQGFSEEFTVKADGDKLTITNNTGTAMAASAAADITKSAGGKVSGGLELLSEIDVSTSDGAKAGLAAIEGLIQTSIDTAAAFGSAQGRIETQSNFVSKLSDSLKSGIGALVDANMEEASARLQALQVQQQLATQSLSIANQAPQAILSLFR